MKKVLIFAFVFFTISATAQRNRFKNIKEVNGKVGIGTTTPDALLTVKGDIHTQEVRVDLDGAVAPDYVFEKYFYGTSKAMPHYNLISLPALEEYLKTNLHLPEVPSATTLEEKGLSLKEMNLILLKKIEELTLYTLQQQKEIDALKELIKNN